MRRILTMILLLAYFVIPVSAMDFSPPEAPDRVSELIETPADSFGQGLWNVIRSALLQGDSAMGEAMSCCLRAMGAVLIAALLRQISGGISGKTIDLGCTAAVAAVLLEPSAAMIRLGMDTGTELREYGRLLLPVMTGAMAAQGGVTSSAALYAGTVLFDGALSGLMTRLMEPMLRLYLALAIGVSVFREPILEKIRDFLPWTMGWVLKGALYLFSAYMTITGVVSGHADAMALRATKAAISTAVPVIGGVLSDASEAVLVSAGTLGSSAGIYGILTVLALFSGPFLRIGAQYLVLKAVSTLCAALDDGGASSLLSDYSGAMGLILGMIGIQTVFLLISTMCLMKGVG